MLGLFTSGSKWGKRLGSLADRVAMDGMREDVGGD